MAVHVPDKCPICEKIFKDGERAVVITVSDLVNPEHYRSSFYAAKNKKRVQHLSSGTKRAYHWNCFVEAAYDTPFRI